MRRHRALAFVLWVIAAWLLARVELETVELAQGLASLAAPADCTPQLAGALPVAPDAGAPVGSSDGDDAGVLAPPRALAVAPARSPSSPSGAPVAARAAWRGRTAWPRGPPTPASTAA